MYPPTFAICQNSATDASHNEGGSWHLVFSRQITFAHNRLAILPPLQLVRHSLEVKDRQLKYCKVLTRHGIKSALWRLYNCMEQEVLLNLNDIILR